MFRTMLVALTMALLAACGGGEGEPEPTAAPTSDATATVFAGQTAEMANRIATADALPTRTPTPAATPTPDNKAEELAYLLAIYTDATEIIERYEEISALLGAPNALSASWQTSMTTAIDSLVPKLREARDRESPSPRYDAYAKAYAAAVDTYIEGMITMRSGVTSLDSNTIRRATTLLGTARQQLDTATALLPK